METGFKFSYKSSLKDASSLTVYNVGHQQCDPGYQWGPGVRDHYLIHHVLEGRGIYKWGGTEFAVGPGDTFLVYPFTEVLYCADGTEPWEYCWAGFAGNDAAPLLAMTDFTPDSPVVRQDFGEELSRPLLAVYEARGQRPPDALRMTGRLYEALAVLIEHASARKEHDVGRLLAMQAADFVAHNYGSPIRVEEMAEAVGISRSYLYRVFVSLFGVSPKRYLAETRMNQAALLLATTELPVSVIASSVGFDNALYFSKAFRATRGMTPTAYRERGGMPPATEFPTENG